MNKKKSTFLTAILIVFTLSASALYSYAQTEDGNSLDINNQLDRGNIAVAHYNTSSGLTLITDAGSYTENSAEDGEISLDFSNETAPKAVRADENGLYLTGTYDNSAIVFYVRETAEKTGSLKIKMNCIDEKMHFAGIGSPDSPDINTTVSLGINDGSDFGKMNIINGCADPDGHTISIDYRQCFYDDAKNAYQILIKAENGMVCITELELTGLELVNISGDRKDISYENGKLAAGHDEELNACYLNIRNQMATDITYKDTDSSSLIRNFLYRLYDFIVKITVLIRSIFTVKG